MGNLHGLNTSLIVDGYDLSTFLNKAGNERTKAMHLTTTFQAVVESRYAGLLDGKISASGLWDGTAISGPDARADAQMNGAQVAATMGLNKTIVGVTNRAILGLSRQSDYKIELPYGNVDAFTFDFNADGGLYGGYYLHDQVTESANGTGAWVDFGANAGALTAYIANLHVLAVTGSPTLVVNLQRGDGVTGTTIATFSTQNAIGAAQVKGVTGITGNQYRITWTIAGATTAKFVVAAAFIKDGV